MLPQYFNCYHLGTKTQSGPDHMWSLLSSGQWSRDMYVVSYPEDVEVTHELFTSNY